MATYAPDGPRHSPVWFLWEDAAIWIIGNVVDDTFPDRVRRDERCSVGVVDFNPRTGLVHHVSFRGRGAVVPIEAQRAERLLARYLGPAVERWDARFGIAISDENAVFVRIEPDSVLVRDQSYVVASSSSTV
ncbi:MAG: pyridoxamine 5'-phosphate oxidase family protein [Candidatus Eremiobacteraeota bacterium]|nr:pyridoxamine 5'-phosphate oxidase family protein [Candidatus Eremiobacteraeota bacterium]